MSTTWYGFERGYSQGVRHGIDLTITEPDEQMMMANKGGIVRCWFTTSATVELE